MATQLQTESKNVIGRSFKPVTTGLLQRKCACGNHTPAGGKCEECAKKKQVLQRKATEQSEATEVPTIVHDVLSSPGQPLDPATRAFMEPRFGHDFSRVRVHANAKAAESAKSVNAQAYTVGRNVVFGTGQYAPGTSEGERLLAHELTHVVQQKQVSASQANVVMRESTEGRFEEEAHAVSNSIGMDQVSVLGHVHTPQIQLQGAGGGAAAASHRFTAEGVSVVVRTSCAPAVFGFANVEDATRTALNAIFNTDCIEETRRTRIQRNLTAHGLDIRCRRSANLETPGACAESTGFFIPANIFTLGSSSFSGHPDSSAGCQPLESTILHEIVHLTRGFAQESLPSSCEASCFGVGGGDPVLCRDIDVFGRHRVA
jgi:hypothetical protein